MLNRIILIGRLARDPELRYTTNGVAVATFALAVQRSFANQNGEREADFIDVVVWRKQAETCANHLGKGRLVAIEGRLQTRSYDDSNGIRRKVAEVVAENIKFLEWAKDGSSQGSSVNNNSNSNNNNKFNNQNNDDFGFGDDIDVPF